MTSSTPDPPSASSPAPSLIVEVADKRLVPGTVTEVRGAGDLTVRLAGQRPNGVATVMIGPRAVELPVDAQGRAAWIGAGLLGGIAGALVISAGDQRITLNIRPSKLASAAMLALITDLEAIAEGLSRDAGGLTSSGYRSREGDLAALDQAVGLASSAAAAIRRRPIHRAREDVRAVARVGGARTAADARWLATHPVAAARAAATGREVGVHRTRRADLDTLENRGVLSTYDRLEAGLSELQQLIAGERARLFANKEARRAFLTEDSNLWIERDLPRVESLDRRRLRLQTLSQQVTATRLRSGLPDLRPRGPRMLRTPRTDAEPAYWTTFRASLLCEEAAAARAVPSPSPVGALDELWERWCAVTVAAALARTLGPPDGAMIDRGWFASLRHGEIARWGHTRLLYEPEYATSDQGVRRLSPGRPWRPDLVIEISTPNQPPDLHILDAKFRIGERDDPPMDALEEVWWKYGEGIGDDQDNPLVRSVWILWPGRQLRTLGPAMLQPRWPPARLRGGAIGLWPGSPPQHLDAVLSALIQTAIPPKAAK